MKAHLSIMKDSLSHVLDMLHKAQDSWAVLSSLILEEFFLKGLLVTWQGH